tara:strand:- start:49 stop:1161 length:1113 start_codon:yes stop_codon:yes gene_type:complete
MKKLLGIVVLGLLFCGNAYADIIKFDNCKSSMHDIVMEVKINKKDNKVTVYFSTGDIKDYQVSHDAISNIYTTPTYRFRSDLEKAKYEFYAERGQVIWYYYTKKFFSEGYKEDNVVSYNCNKPELIAEKPKETPKKKKPKASPDDDKIVPAGSGSGFFVSKDGHAITNYHVIEGCDINKLSFKGSQTEVKVLAVDKVNDIAILKSNTKPDVIFPVSNEDVSLLEDVIVAGFPLGKQISSAIKTHKGVVTALAGAGDNYSFFQTDAAINQGNSGGPIINQKGNVVGIAVATWVEKGVQGVHFGIKSSILKTFASANGLSFASPNYRELSNKDLGKLITKGTVYVECHMTVAKIKKMIAQTENRKAFFKEHK